MNTKKIYLLILMFAGFRVSAQDTLSLEQAIDLGMQNNYSIIIARNTEQIARNSNTIGNAGFLPQVNANYNNNNGIVNSKTVLLAGGTREGTGVKTNNTNANALVNWTVFDGFNMFINKNRLEELERAGEWQARMNIENTVSQIITTYYVIVQQQKMLSVIKSAIDLSSQRLKLTQQMKEIGTGSEQAILQAMVDVNADSSAYIQQIFAIQNSKADLNRLLARDVNTAFEVKDNITITTGMNYADLVGKMDKENAQLLVARANMNIAEYAIHSYQSQYYPTVNLFGGYNYGKIQNPLSPAALSQSKGLTYGLTASINLFNGGVTALNVQNAKVLLQNNKLQYEDTRLLLQNQLYRAYNNYTGNLRLYEIQKGNVGIAGKDVEISMVKYKLGSITDIDLRIIQQKLIDAQNTLISSQYAAKQAEIELKRLSGGLLTVQ
ncbi:MAG: TolC family protein [Cytophagaceae bacterium]